MGSADRDPTRQASRCVCGDHGQWANAAWVRELGADVSIDYRTEEFATIVHDYDLAVDSLGGDNLESSLGVLPRGGKAIGISGPPDPAFAQEIDASLMLRLAMTALSRGIRRKARRLGVIDEFLFMRASGDQIAKIAALVDAAAIRPVIGRIVPFDQTPEALAALSKGGVRGKVVISYR